MQYQESLTTQQPDDALAKFICKCHSYLSHLENGLSFLGGLTIFLLTILGASQVISRFFFNQPIPGYIDLVEQAMVVFAFLGIAHCQRTDGHIRMEMVLERLKGRLLWGIESLTTLLANSLFFLLILGTYQHFFRAWTNGDTTINIGLVVWPSKLLIPLMFGLLFLRVLIQFFGYVRLAIDPTKTPTAVPVILSVEEKAEQAHQETKESE